MRPSTVSAVVLVLVAAAAVQARAQDATYEKRFIEEVQRKVPPILIPPPSAKEMAAAPGPVAQPVSIDAAKALMGLDAQGGDLAARIPGGKLGIVDFGFRGLKEWLASHPDEAKLTAYMGESAMGNGKGLDSPELTNPKTPDHGYWVYRTARAVLPGVPIYLFVDDEGTTEGALDPVIMASKKYGISVFSMSLGDYGDCSLNQAKEPEFDRDLRFALVQHETFLFVAAGNARTAAHAWISADRDKDGYVDFRTAAQAAADSGSTVDGERVALSPGDNQFIFGWDGHKFKDARYALELDAPSGSRLATVSNSANEAAQCLILDYNAPQQQPAVLRVKRLAGPAQGVPMRLNAYGDAVAADYDGLQTVPGYEYRDNPFVIFVGGFGKTAGGHLAPSSFSDIGRTAHGRLVPDVLGPGQLLIDGQEHDGTSFATPFLAALYATRVGYNLKNLVALTADDSRFAPGVQPFARSRWGIPDATKVNAQLEKITGPTVVDHVTHAVEGKDLVVHYTISRCCMQSLIWYAGVVIVDPKTEAVLPDAAGKAIMAIQSLRTNKAGRVRYPITLRIPMRELAPYKGKTVKLYFGLRVRAWAHPPPGSLKVDKAPDVRITL